MFQLRPSTDGPGDGGKVSRWFELTRGNFQPKKDIMDGLGIAINVSQDLMSVNLHQHQVSSKDIGVGKIRVLKIEGLRKKGKKE